MSSDWTSVSLRHLPHEHLTVTQGHIYDVDNQKDEKHMTGNDLTEVKLKIGSERDRTREAQTPDDVCGSCDALWLQRRTNESPPSLHSDPLMLEDLRRS